MSGKIKGTVTVSVSSEQGNVVNATNYVHNRLSDGLVQYFSNSLIDSIMGGSSSKLALPFYSMAGNYDDGFSGLSSKLDSLVLAKGTPKENNPYDDTLLEADEINSITYLDPSNNNASHHWRQGIPSSSTKRYPNGDIDIVVDYGSSDHIEFDTVYLAGAQNLYYPLSNYPVEKLEYRHKNAHMPTSALESVWGTSVSSYGVMGMGSYAVNGNPIFFLSAIEFIVVIGVKSKTLHLAKYRYLKNSSKTSYSDTELVEYYTVSLDNAAIQVTSGNGYSVADVTPDGKIYLISDTSNSKSSTPLYSMSVDNYAKRDVSLHVINMSGVLESSVVLEKTGELTGCYGDSIKVGNYIYVLATRLDGYDIYSQTSSYSSVSGRVDTSSTKRASIELQKPAVCKYSLSGRLLGVCQTSNSMVSGGDSRESLVALYHMYYDSNVGKIVVYDSLYSTASSSEIFKIDPDKMTCIKTKVRARGFKLSYNKYNNRLYSIISSQAVSGVTKMAIMVKHLAPISTKCKLPSKVVKKAGQTMTLTYKLRAGSPVD